MIRIFSAPDNCLVREWFLVSHVTASARDVTESISFFISSSSDTLLASHSAIIEANKLWDFGEFAESIKSYRSLASASLILLDLLSDMIRLLASSRRGLPKKGLRLPAHHCG